VVDQRKMRNSALEGLRDRTLEDIQLDTLVIVFSSQGAICRVKQWGGKDFWGFMASAVARAYMGVWGS